MVVGGEQEGINIKIAGVVIEKIRSFQYSGVEIEDNVCVFKDFEKAFDKIPREKLLLLIIILIRIIENQERSTEGMHAKNKTNHDILHVN